MNCVTLESVLKSCDNGNIGGIKKIEIYEFDATFTAGTAYTGSSVVIEFAKESASFSETQTSDLATGAISVAQTLTCIVPKRDATKINAVKILAAGQRDLMIKMTDANGEVGYMGVARGANLTKVDTTSGAKAGDANGITLTFSGAEPTFA